MKSAVEITQDLVAIPSMNPMGRTDTSAIYSERAAAAYIADFLGRYGIDCSITAKDPAHPNVMATLDGGCTETVMLEAHMDTVPHDEMVIDPFDPIVADGRLYGRGSCDTKASLAAYLHAIARVASSGEALKRNVILAAVHDEEFGFSGSRLLVERKPDVAFAVVGEPTSLDIVHAHKGCCRFFVKTQGTTAHASTPWLGESAIYAMADVITLIRAYGERLKERVDPLLGAPTVSVGRIEGGEAVNIVPGRCTIEVDRRLLPGETFDVVREELETMLKPLGVSVTIDDAHYNAPGFYVDSRHAAAQALQEACIAAGRTPAFRGAHFVTDASILAAAGIPCVVFGPGSAAKAHTKDEYVEVSEITEAAAIIRNLIAG